MVPDPIPSAAATAKAHSVFIRLVLPPYTIHFKSPTYLQPATLDLLDRKISKETLKSTTASLPIRRAIGEDPKFWSEFALLLRAAIPSLERRSFAIWDPSSVDYESTSGALIAGHYPALWRDLERLNDLVSVSRNVLTVGERAQNRAARYGVDVEIFRLINCCVRVTARGYDGDAGTGEEEKWQWIVNAYKKLLITALQFLNNFVAQNEQRKVLLWVALFDCVRETVVEDGPGGGEEEERQRRAEDDRAPRPVLTADDVILAYGEDGQRHISPAELDAATPLYDDSWFKPLPCKAQECIANKDFGDSAYVYFAQVHKDSMITEFAQIFERSPTLGDIHRNMPWEWHYQVETEHDGDEDSMWEYWQDQYRSRLVRDHRLSDYVTDKQLMTGSTPPDVSHQVVLEDLEEKLHVGMIEQGIFRQSGVSSEFSIRQNQPIDLESVQAQKDVKMLFTASAGSKILESGKAELMKRLEVYDSEPAALPAPSASQEQQAELADVPWQEFSQSRSIVPPPISARRRSANSRSLEQAFDSAEEEEEESEEGDDDDEDYPGSTEDGRGLLTDVPLILGPSEIEVLPMLIMSGVVPTSKRSKQLSELKLGQNPDEDIEYLREYHHDQVSQVHLLRTHLLVSQTSGRNLLRELLIFVAAWDLREEELYFKFMVKIMEAILKTGLMPYAYHMFRDRSRSKDIISPAQAVIMKLLTCIFRGRCEVAKQLEAAQTPGSAPAIPPASMTDLHILNFVFTEFRQHIIPQTCALIFLQGQIFRGNASPDDFPLNLWDMERMYEGVYQYLEFFAVLCEEPNGFRAGDSNGQDGKWSWRELLAQWEMTSELVTLLKELEDGIPKLGIPARPPAPRLFVPPAQLRQRSLSVGATSMPPPPLSVERPFNVTSPPTTKPTTADVQPPTNWPPPSLSLPKTPSPEMPLAYPEDPTMLPPDHSRDDQDEPSSFEWRNLKKLTVLVLSSLLMRKNKPVQDQVRQLGGLEALAACCKQDEHNPHIKEQAIMCLRFAMEGNAENDAAVRKIYAEEKTAANAAAAIRAKRPEWRGDPNAGTVLFDDFLPNEVLDPAEYETFMDGKGQVGLRRRNSALVATNTNPAVPTAAPAAPAATTTKPSLPSSTTKLTAERAAEMFQDALKGLPLGEKLVTDRQKAEALKRLDRAFESTEKALEKGGPGVGVVGVDALAGAVQEAVDGYLAGTGASKGGTERKK